jgi:hypothetical protein
MSTTEDKRKVGDIDVEKLQDNVDIHGEDQSRHLERAQIKEAKVTEDKDTGSWKIDEEDEK